MWYKIGLLICLLPGLASGQFIFQNLRTSDGLSSKVIRCLYKDEDGYVWIGTIKGLNRFDGAIVKQYSNDPGFKDLYITAIQPLALNELLVGTRQGVKIFNRREGAFKYDRRFASLDNIEIFNIYLDGYLRLWLLTQSGIYIFANGKLRHLESEIPEAKILRNAKYNVSILTWDESRSGFWMGGPDTYFIDCKKKAVYHKFNNPEKIPILDTQDVFAIALDKAFNLWYGCNKTKTLNFWSRKANKAIKYAELDGEKIYEGCNYIFIDKKDRVWISTWAFAAYLKEPGEPVRKIPYSQNRKYSIGYGFFWTAIEDAEGNIWIGTLNGISKVQANAPVQAIYQLPSFKYFLHTGFAHANSIAVEGNTIMASKEDGIVKFDIKTRKYQRYVATHGPDLVRNKFFMSVKSKSLWWFAGLDGIHYLRPGNDRLEAFKKGSFEFKKKPSNFIFADSIGNIWFQILDDALYRYDPLKDLLDRFDGKNARFGSFRFTNSQSYLVKSNGDILFALNGQGIVKFDITSQRFSEVYSKQPYDFFASQMVEDEEGNLWMVVWGKGVLKLDKNYQLIDSLNTGNGLPYDNLGNIAIDHLNNIWASGIEGIQFFNPVSKAITKVEVDLGQNLQDYWNDLFVLDKRIYATMLDHVVVLDPSKFAAVKVKKPPHITSVKIFGNEKEDFMKNPQLNLTPEEDYLTFQYASLDHRDVPSLKYSYLLEGFDHNWINAGRSLTASYKNLPWGKYIFKVRSTDERGNWMNEFSALNIYIMPLWWQTSWFLACASLLVICLITVLYFSWLKRKRKHVMEASIDYFANSIYGENSVNEICWDIARNCISQLHFQDCVVYLLDPNKNLLVQKAAYGYKNPNGQEIENPAEIALGKGIIGTVAMTGRHLLISDTSKDPRYVVVEERRFSELSVPILHDGKVIGVIDSEHMKRNFFKHEHLKALTIISSISAGKIAEALAQTANREKEMELLKINKMLAESQLMALRAQMNPHFVFNCLNSIQECIVTEKFGEASKYLNLFAKLFRTLLNNSGKILVTIEEERDILQLYLQLEEMRFGKTFSYEIIVDEELEAEEILVPSMLIQPYVENALWHGLLHSKLERKLQIEFKKMNEDIFECRIDDNGIGRKKSFEIKASSFKTRHHVSRGLGISSDRLAVLSRQGHHAEVNFVDKMHDNGEAAGTLVIVRLSSYLK